MAMTMKMVFELVWWEFKLLDEKSKFNAFAERKNLLSSLRSQPELNILERSYQPLRDFSQSEWQNLILIYNN